MYTIIKTLFVILLTLEAYAGTGGGQKPSSPPQQPSPQVPPASPSETLPQPSPTPAAVPPAPPNGTTQPSPNNALQNPLAWGGAVALGGLGVGAVVVGRGINKFMDQRLAPALQQVGESAVKKLDERIFQPTQETLKNSGASYAHNANFIVDNADQTLQFSIENGEPIAPAEDQPVYQVKQQDGGQLVVVGADGKKVENLEIDSIKILDYVHKNAKPSTGFTNVLSKDLVGKAAEVIERNVGQPLKEMITSSGASYTHNANFILDKDTNKTLEFSVENGQIVSFNGHQGYRVKQQGGELVVVDLNGQRVKDIPQAVLSKLPDYVHGKAARPDTALQVMTREVANPFIGMVKQSVVDPLMESLHDMNTQFLHIGNRMLSKNGKVLEFIMRENKLVPVPEHVESNAIRYQVQQVKDGMIKVFDASGNDTTAQFQNDKLKLVKDYVSEHGLKPESAAEIVTKTLTSEVRSTVEQIVQKDLKPLIEPVLKSLTSTLPAYKTSLLDDKHLLVNDRSEAIKIPAEGPTLQLRQKQTRGTESVEYEFVKGNQVIKATGHLSEALEKLKKQPKESLQWSDNGILLDGVQPRTFFEDASGRGNDFYYVQMQDNAIKFLAADKKTEVILGDQHKPQAEQFLRDHAPLANHALLPVIDHVMTKLQMEKITQELAPGLKKILEEGHAQIGPTLASLQTIVKGNIEPLIKDQVTPLIKDLSDSLNKFVVGPGSAINQAQAVIAHVSGLLGLDMVTLPIETELEKITDSIKAAETPLELHLMVEHELNKFNKMAAELAGAKEKGVEKFEDFRKNGKQSTHYRSLSGEKQENFRKEFAKYEIYRGQLMHKLKAALANHPLKEQEYHTELMSTLDKYIQADKKLYTLIHPSSGWGVYANALKQAVIPSEEQLDNYIAEFKQPQGKTNEGSWGGYFWGGGSSAKDDKRAIDVDSRQIIRLINEHGLTEVVRPVLSKNTTTSLTKNTTTSLSLYKPELFSKAFDHLMTQHLEVPSKPHPLGPQKPHAVLQALVEPDELQKYQEAAEHKTLIHKLIKLAEEHQSSLQTASGTTEIKENKQEAHVSNEKTPAKAESVFTPDALRKRFATINWHDHQKRPVDLKKALDGLSGSKEYEVMNNSKGGNGQSSHPIVEHLQAIHKAIKAPAETQKQNSKKSK